MFQETDQLVEDFWSRLGIPGIANQKYEKIESTSLNFPYSAQKLLWDRRELGSLV